MKWSLYLLWFLMIFAPALDSPLGPLGDLTYLLSLALIPRLFFRHRMSRLEGVLSVILLTIFFQALLMTMLFEPGTPSEGLRATFRPIRALIVLLGMASLVEYSIARLKAAGNDPVDILHKIYWLIFTSVGFHAVIMVLQFTVPSFRESIYAFTYAKYQLEFYQQFRMAGLSRGGGAQLSAVMGTGFGIGVYLFMKNKFRTLVVACNILIFASVLLSGRSGLVAIAFSVFLVLILVLLAGRIRRLNVEDLKIVLLLFAVPPVMGLGAEVLFQNEFMETVVLRTFETFFDYQDTGTVSDVTLVALSEMIVVPDGFLHLFLGRPSYLATNTLYGINTDIGYFQLIWGYGVLGMLVHVGFYLVLLAGAWAFPDRSVRIFSLFLVGLFLIYNAKENFAFSAMSFQIILGCLLPAYRLSFMTMDRREPMLNFSSYRRAAV